MIRGVPDKAWAGEDVLVTKEGQIIGSSTVSVGGYKSSMAQLVGSNKGTVPHKVVFDGDIVLPGAVQGVPSLTNGPMESGGGIGMLNWGENPNMVGLLTRDAHEQ